MQFSSSITSEEIEAVRNRLNEGMNDSKGNPIWNETAEQWYQRNVATAGEDIAVSRFKAKANAMLQQE